jgi:hypothetical protein
MRQKRIALLACSNGMGHIRRLLALSVALRECGAHPVLLAEEDKLRRLGQTMQVAMPDFIPFCSRTERSDWMEPGEADWTLDLPALDDFDVVVSDNLVEVLAVRPDAWLSGSFFWHRVLECFPAAKAEYAESLLMQYRPRMISSRLFASPYLQAFTRLSTVGLYAFAGLGEQGVKRNFLLACGTGGGAISETAALVRSLASGEQPPCHTLWIEPAMYEDGMPPWIQPATFSPAMYAGIGCAIIRPGVGTATDALLAGARVFSFYEAGNDEMVFNATCMAAAGVGEDCGTAQLAWQAAMRFANTPDEQEAHKTAVSAMDRNGAYQAARLILQDEGGKEIE